MAVHGSELTRALVHEAAKASPPVGVSAYALMTNALPTLVALATLIYIVAQTAYLAWKWRREWGVPRNLHEDVRGGGR